MLEAAIFVKLVYYDKIVTEKLKKEKDKNKRIVYMYITFCLQMFLVEFTVC